MGHLDVVTTRYQFWIYGKILKPFNYGNLSGNQPRKWETSGNLGIENEKKREYKHRTTL